MEINDNGRSFSVEQTLQKKHPQRLGLIGMGERIEMVGGRMTLQSSPGKGTTVTAEIPCQPPLPHEIPKTRSRSAG
jgi:signal transduction histidine kinase